MSSIKSSKPELGAHSTPAVAGNNTATTETAAGAPKSSCCGQKDWDFHPACIRHIENVGSPADVKLLHEMEQQCPRAAKNQH
ncbi:hypothetical protein BGZ88_007717 [Linnemannia elongata]|nr:hypothetical protein BGZ88_007717 [Linnemannia elongata]KAF9340435.1 hypothetical protein BGZ91_002061 [Linnemannia elongata]KAG0072078.1 hypothetical protein BGZ89_008316 [Linnemannia elongata]KAG0082147.1 hypothetical protein BGZ90_011165 [Linnemannia elongata]